jgi:hypothetical protein
MRRHASDQHVVVDEDHGGHRMGAAATKNFAWINEMNSPFQ